MKILLVEDEKVAAQTLKRALVEVAPEAEVVSIIPTVKETIRYLLSEPTVDLIFLDIHLADGSVFEIFEIVSPSAPIVFITAYDSYAVKAFEINSLDYLLKPISTERLKQTIIRFTKLKNYPVGQEIKDIASILKNFQETHWTSKNRFLVKGGSRLLSIEISQIAYFYRGKEAVFLMTTKGKPYIINYSLEMIEDLVDSKIFFRLNRQIIAKFSALADIHNYFNGKLKITLNPQAPFEVLVSQERSKYFKNWLEQ